MLDSERTGPDFEFRLALERFHRFERGFRRISSALDLAATVHSGQRRRSGTPYMVHPLMVAAMLRERSAPVEVIVAGLVHDVIDDSAVTAEELEATVGQDVLHIVEAAGHAALGHNLALSESDRIRRLARLFERPGVAELHACNRMVSLRTALDGLPEANRAAIIDDTRLIIVPAIRSAGLDQLADDLQDTTEARSDAVQLPFDDLVQALVPDDFAAFSRTVAQKASSLNIASTVPAALVLERLERLESMLKEESAPSLKDLLGDVAFIDLKGVWTWAEYMIKRGRRSRQVAEGIERQADAQLEAMDRSTGGIVDCLIASGTVQPDTGKLRHVARLIGRLRRA